jgi:methylenetetrahydrofolate dehydrogenase (NADP+)/methenyltetrahydrofolate cyclohydrolase
MAQILDGLKISNEIKQEIKTEVDKIKASGKRIPHLSAILVGNNGASKAYVNSKVKDCAEVGFESSLYKFPSTASEAELLEKIEELNNDPNVDGFIVQLPLPKQMDQEKIIMAINPRKDVDGFHPENFGRMALEMDTFLPATPFGILTLLERYNIETKGKHCVIIGRSRIVGRPMSILMGRKDFPGNSTVKSMLVISATGAPLTTNAPDTEEKIPSVPAGVTDVK